MPKKMKIAFIPKDSNISAPVTKFGGQPFWLEKPQWPLSRELGSQMQFICQIALNEKMFPGGGGKIAYLFMSADDEEFVDLTYDPDAGENAVIIQPSEKVRVPVIEMATGPTLQALNSDDDPGRVQSEKINWTVDLTEAEDPDFLTQEALWELSAEEQEARSAVTDGIKIGGIPDFLQNDEFPDDDFSWRLLLQLHSTDIPFSINFGDAGTGYAFINEDASEGRFLWQCF